MINELAMVQRRTQMEIFTSVISWMDRDMAKVPWQWKTDIDMKESGSMANVMDKVLKDTHMEISTLVNS